MGDMGSNELGSVYLVIAELSQKDSALDLLAWTHIFQSLKKQEKS